MKAWIISIVCVIVLGVLLEIVLPKGKMAKYVKGTFALVVIFVIVSPLPKLLKKEWNFDFSSAWASANNTFLQETERDRTQEQEDEVETYLAFYGYDSDVEISKESSFAIEEVCVTIHGKINDVEQLKTLVANKLNVKIEMIRVVQTKDREESV